MAKTIRSAAGPRPLSEIASERNGNSQERELAQLIEAAVENEIIIPEGESGGIFGYTFKGSSRHFKVFFDEPTGGQDGAERVLRASEFITALFDSINRGYNCFVAPATNTRPAPSVVKARLYGDRDDVTVAFKEAKEGESGVSDRIYELDFNILVALGERYERINDHILARTVGTNPDGTPSVRYVYEQAPHYNEAKDSFRPSDSEMKDSRSQAEKIVRVINGNKAKKEILSAFASAADSRLHNYLDSLPAELDRQVGEMNLQLCSVFVGAVSVTTYIYRITEGDVSFDLPIVWNKSGSEFKTTTPLYIMTDNDGNFEGLSFSEEKKDENGNVTKRALLEESDKIAVAYGYKKDEGLSDGVTLLLPEGHKVSEAYKGVANCAVRISDVSDRLLNVLDKDGGLKRLPTRNFFSSSVEALDSGVYLKSDVDSCAYSGKRLWLGSLTAGKVEFVDEKGKLSSGFIDADIEKKHKRVCGFCGKVFYADEGRFITYRNAHLLLDGGSYCDGCLSKGNAPVSYGGKKYRLYTNVRTSDSAGAPDGKLMVLVDSKGAPVKAGQGSMGNLFSCSNCGHNIYYMNSGSLSSCEVCGADLCLRCNSTKRDREEVRNKGLRICAACPKPVKGADGVEISTPLSGSRNRGSCLVRVRTGSDRNSKCLVLENSVSSQALYTCLVCDSLVYYDASTQLSCKLCGRHVCPACEAEEKRRPGVGFKDRMIRHPDIGYELICRDCRSDVEGKYAATIASLKAERDGYYDKVSAIKREVSDLESRIKEEIKSNVNNRYFPLIPLIHRMKLIGACKRKRYGSFQIRVTNAAYFNEKKYSAQVEITVSGTTYRFVNLSGKVTLEEIR